MRKETVISLFLFEILKASMTLPTTVTLSEDDKVV